MRQDRFYHIAAGHKREVKLAVPFGHVEFAVGVHIADLEGLECCGFVAEEFKTDFIKVACPFLEWNVSGPVVRIALERDKAVGLKIGDFVFA